jgi:hypothetical protein
VEELTVEDVKQTMRNLKNKKGGWNWWNTSRINKIWRK